MAPLCEETRVIILSQAGSGGRYSSVGNRILHIAGDGLVVEVGGNEPILFTEVKASVLTHGSSPDGLPCLILVETTYILDHSVGDGYDSGVSDHAVSLVGHQMPDRKPSLLFLNIDHRVHHIRLPLRMKDSHQWHLGTVSIP